VEIRSRVHLPAKLVGAGEAFEFSGGQVIRTDSGGRFTTPAVPRTGLYQATVAPPGRERAESEWVFLPPQGTAILRDLVVPRRISARGTVADHAGRPLAGAKVDLLFANGRESAATDSKGHFEFSSVPDGPALLTIQHSDCRFYGERLTAVSAAFERRLTRLTEPSPVGMTTRPLMPRDERLRLAHVLFDPYRDRLMAKPVALNKLGALARVGASLDPRDLVRQLREKASAVPAVAGDALRTQIVLSLGAENMDEAREIIEEAAEPGSKANMLCGLCQAVTDSGRKRELLADALVQARSSQNPSLRVMGLAHVASLLLDLGEKEQGTAVLKDAAADVKGLPPLAQGFRARTEVAVVLARIDVPAAVGLYQGVKVRPQAFAHACGWLAHVVAGIEPAEAENVLKMIPEQTGPNTVNWQNLFVPLVCCRMAGRDLPRARRLADRLDSAASRGFAYGAMADTLATTDRRAATELLRRAFALLDAARSEEPNPLITPAAAAGALVITAEKIDPSLVPEFFWHAVSFARPRSDDESPLARWEPSNCDLAALLARYDREVAAMIFQAGDAGDISSALRLVSIDPQRAVDCVESLPALDNDGWPRDTSRLQVAGELALPDASFWNRTSRDTIGWLPDTDT
jgi:hypothetical protein